MWTHTSSVLTCLFCAGVVTYDDYRPQRKKNLPRASFFGHVNSHTHYDGTAADELMQSRHAPALWQPELISLATAPIIRQEAGCLGNASFPILSRRSWRTYNGQGGGGGGGGLENSRVYPTRTRSELSHIDSFLALPLSYRPQQGL